MGNEDGDKMEGNGDDKELEHNDKENNEEYDDEKIREFWDKNSASLQSEVDVLRTKNMAASASADVMHKHLRAQLDSVRKQLVTVKGQRENNRNKNMQFELEVIELTELVNNLKENVDSQRHDNFLKLSKQRERQKREEIQRYNQMKMNQMNEDNKNNQEGTDNDAATSSQQINLIKGATEYPP